MLNLDYRDARPIYEQVRDGLRRLMVSGVIQEGEQLPSVRAMATSLAINPNTIQRAYELLEAEGCDLSQGVVVVSNGFHLTRARMLAERAGYDSVSTLAAPSSHLPSRLHMYVREPLALVKSFFLDR